MAWTGGIGETKRLASMAEAFGLPIVLHNAGGPIAHMANPACGRHIPNLFEMETVRAFYRTYFKELTDIEIKVVDGHLPLPPERPGLGIDLQPGHPANDPTCHACGQRRRRQKPSASHPGR